MSEETQVQESSQPLVGEILEFTRLHEQDEGYELARQGVEAMLSELLAKPEPVERVDKSLVDQMIEELDQRLGQQLDAILHNDAFQQLEAAWRGLAFLVNRTDFNENIRVELLNVEKEELLEDFEEAPELNGQFGGEP